MDTFPTEAMFWDTLGDEEIETYNRLKVWDGKKGGEDRDQSHQISKNAPKLTKLKQELEILTEQEKPQSTEEEEKMVRYWQDGLDRCQEDDSGEKHLLLTLQQIEEKYRRAKADVEAKLVAHKEKKMITEHYYSKGLKNAKQTLESIRTFKSKPRIRLEMMIKPLQEAREAYWAEVNGVSEWQKIKKDIEERKTAWLRKERDAYLKRMDEEDARRALTPMPSAPPRPKIAQKTVRKITKAVQPVPTTEDIVKDVLNGLINQIVSNFETQSSSISLEVCNSEVASPCATKGHEVSDPQQVLV